MGAGNIKSVKEQLAGSGPGDAVAEVPTAAVGVPTPVRPAEMPLSTVEAQLLEKYMAAAAEHGPTHAETTHAALLLAKHFYGCSQYGDARTLYEHCLAATFRGDYTTVVSEETLSVMNDLANVYFRQGLYAQAEPLYRAALARREVLLGPMAAATLVSLNNLALVLKATGHVKAAVPLLRDCLLKRRCTLGESAAETLRTQALLGNAYKELKKYELAVSLYTDVIRKRNAAPAEVLHHGHTTTGSLTDTDVDLHAVKNALAGVYFHTGQLVLAEHLYTACWEETKGSGDPSSLKPLHNLAKVQEKAGRVDEALQTHLRCLQLRRQMLGDRHAHTLKSVRSVAEIYTRRGMLKEAEPYRQEVLRRQLGKREGEFLSFMEAEEED